jgi:hypothetical protein
MDFNLISWILVVQERNVYIPITAGVYFPRHRVQNDGGADQASYPMGTVGKAVGAWSWQLTSI